MTIIGVLPEEMQSSTTYSIGSGITKAKLADDSYVLLRYNEGIFVGTGGSVFASNQMQHFGIKVDDEPACYGGSQQLLTLEGIDIPLVYHDALSYVSLSYPTDQDLETLDTIDITSDMPWNPAHLDASIDVWEDAQETFEQEDEFFDPLITNSDAFLLPLSCRDCGNLLMLFRRHLRPPHSLSSLFQLASPCASISNLAFLGSLSVDFVKSLPLTHFSPVNHLLVVSNVSSSMLAR